jgi:hypothetical protein
MFPNTVAVCVCALMVGPPIAQSCSEMGSGSSIANASRANGACLHVDAQQCQVKTVLKSFSAVERHMGVG